jgi:hypothetical protein
MKKVNLKKAVVLSLFILFFNVNANDLGNKDRLAQQCQDLSESVASLISSQVTSICTEKLGLATIQIEKAGYLILDYAYSNAKKELENAMYTLQYAELNSCNRYIQIVHSKFEAHKIKKSLIDNWTLDKNT